MFENMENTAGEIMTPEFLRLRAGTRARDALSSIRNSGLDSDAMYTIYITDESNHLLGVLELRTLLLADDNAAVEALMDPAYHSVHVSDDQQIAADMVRKYDLMSLPVTDEEGCLLGAIGVGSIVDVIEEEDTEDFERMAALVPSDGSYMDATSWTLARLRLPWLLILMISSVLCERLIRSYESFLATSGALGVLAVSCMPMLMDTGGNAGSQSSTAIIRAMALGELSPRETGRALWKEARASLVCGFGLALVNFARLVLLSGTAVFPALAVSTAVLLTVVASNCLGCLLPMLAKTVKLDPALMAGPLLTTIVDVLSLLILFTLITALP